MSDRIRILNVVGARPNFMKIAPLMHEYRKHPERILPMLVHTGQHYDETMSDVFFGELGIPNPDIALGVGSGSHAEQTARIMLAIEPVLLQHRPDLVIVVGDVNSTVACALVAAKLQIPIAHVEAGLRSFDRSMPEEINRLVTDALSDLLFTTSEDANYNLRKEGIPDSKIFFVGNTMIDTLFGLQNKLTPERVLKSLRVQEQRFIYVTLHRPSNVDDEATLRGICEVFAELQNHVPLVWPLHPRTKKMLHAFSLYEFLAQLSHIRLTEPLSYLESISLMSKACLVLTDSGGVQEETTALGVPCLTMRKNTERPVTITEGTNELVGNDPGVIRGKVLALLNGSTKRGRLPKLWDGHAAERIVTVLLEYFSR
jgi:UDP-N-acetylglucosamine 2-epimerase (non-hydrolysing)